jgi:hypothetical protein
MRDKTSRSILVVLISTNIVLIIISVFDLFRRAANDVSPSVAVLTQELSSVKEVMKDLRSAITRPEGRANGTPPSQKPADPSAAGRQKQSYPPSDSDSFKWWDLEKPVAEFVDECSYPYKYSYKRTVEYVRAPNARLDQIGQKLAGDRRLPVRWEGYVDYSLQNAAIPVRHSFFSSKTNEKANLIPEKSYEYFQPGQHVTFEGFFPQYDSREGFNLRKCKIYTNKINKDK